MSKVVIDWDVAIIIYDALMSTLNPSVGAVTAPTEIELSIDFLIKKFGISIGGIAEIISKDSWVLDLFKKAWHDPEYKLGEFDGLLLNKIMESEPGRS